LKYENIPHFIREKIADTWLKEKLIKLYLKSPHKVQYLLAKYGVHVLINKKRSEIEEFMRQ
jgi:hypothetical protein